MAIIAAVPDKYTAKGWLAQAGRSYDSADPNAPLYNVIAARNMPAKGNPQTFPGLAEACLRARGLLYWKTTPGDCGQPGNYLLKTKGSAIVGGIAGGVGQAARFDPEPISKLIISGISTGVGLVNSIFSGHHIAAVKKEEDVICEVAQDANATIPELDALVFSGQISGQQGVTAMQQLVGQLKSRLQTIMKPCNAACAYSALLDAHLDFAQNIYVTASPVATAANPGQPSPMSPASSSSYAANTSGTKASAASLSASNLLANSTKLANPTLDALTTLHTPAGAFNPIPLVIGAAAVLLLILLVK